MQATSGGYVLGPTPVAAAPANTVPAQNASVLGPLGWRSLDGRVIHVEPIYMGTGDFHWGRFLLKIAILCAAVYYYGFIILLGLVALLIFAWLISKVLPQGLVTGVAVQVISFLLTRKLVGPVANVPIRDIRLRDSSGQEYLVRMKGQLTSGSVNVGDDIVAEGYERQGMLLFRRGFNKRIQTVIKIKH
jgi:hypothetical protein